MRADGQRRETGGKQRRETGDRDEFEKISARLRSPPRKLSSGGAGAMFELFRRLEALANSNKSKCDPVPERKPI